MTDNFQQIEEIKKFHRFLQRIAEKEIDEETAAQAWIQKYARLWRLRHSPVNGRGVDQSGSTRTAPTSADAAKCA